MQGIPGPAEEDDLIHRGSREHKARRNPGATAGILANNRWVFMVASTVIIIALAVYLIVSKKQSAFGGIAFAMVLGGGIGNMISWHIQENAVAGSVAFIAESSECHGSIRAVERGYASNSQATADSALFIQCMLESIWTFSGHGLGVVVRLITEHAVAS